MPELHNPIFSKIVYAAETVASLNAVYMENSDVEDDVESYAVTGDVQAVWVDSDAGNKMATLSSGFVNHACNQSILLSAVSPNNTGDYIDKTISSKNLTGYTIHLVINASATSGDWEFLLASGANAATANVKKALVVTSAGVYEHISFTVASMTTDNGSYNSAATIHVGFRCADHTGNPTLNIARIWYEKSGTTYIGVKKCAAGIYQGNGTLGVKTVAVVGLMGEAVSVGATGKLILYAPVVGGFSNLVPGYYYYLDNANNGAITLDVSQATILANPSVPVAVGIAISNTEIELVKDISSPI